MLKNAAVIFIALCALLFVSISVILVRDDSPFPINSGSRIGLVLLTLILSLLLFYHAWRLFSAQRGQALSNSPVSWWTELCRGSGIAPDDIAIFQSHLATADNEAALQFIAELLTEHPNDLFLLWTRADLLLDSNQHVAAESAFTRLLTELGGTNPSLSNFTNIYFYALTSRLRAILLQNDGRFETELTFTLLLIVPDQSKIAMLDQLACIPLTQSKPHLYPIAEKCIRKALQIAPDSLTLKGTLGSLLIEQNNFTDGEPLVRDCYNRSSALHDRGICSYYLALIAAKNADSKATRKLANQAIALHPEPWLTAKANALLHRLDS